jgi:hypothetical protein
MTVQKTLPSDDRLQHLHFCSSPANNTNSGIMSIWPDRNFSQGTGLSAYLIRKFLLKIHTISTPYSFLLSVQHKFIDKESGNI